MMATRMQQATNKSQRRDEFQMGTVSTDIDKLGDKKDLSGKEDDN